MQSLLKIIEKVILIIPTDYLW